MKRKVIHIGIALIILFIGIAYVILPSKQTADTSQHGEPLGSELGHTPRTGELPDTRKRWAISLSEDNKHLAVSVVSDNSSWLEIWNVEYGAKEAFLDAVFLGLDADTMQWHPRKNWILVNTESQGLWLVNLDKSSKRYIGGFYPTFTTWLGDTDQIIAKTWHAGDQPTELSTINVLNSTHKPFKAPWVGSKEFDSITDLVSSRDGYLAVEFTSTHKSTGIAIYKMDNQSGWNRTGTIKGTSGAPVYPMLLRWLSNGRLAYALLYPNKGGNTLAKVEIWTSSRNGLEETKLITLKNAQPPSYNPSGRQWLAISANGELVGFFRNDRVYVMRTGNFK